MDENTSSTPQETSTESISEATPAQETSTESTSSTDTQSTQDNTVPENWEYQGDRKAVPKQFQNYVKGVDRYWSKKSQTLAELGQRVKEYDELKSSDDYKSFQQFQKEKQSNTGRVEPTAPLVTQSDLEAIMLGDTKTLEKVIESKAKQLIDSSVKPELDSVRQERQALSMERKENEAAESIQSFAKLNPDFDELLASPAGPWMVDAAKRGMGLDDIYKSAKEAETFFTERAEKQRKAVLESKKNGSVVGKSIPGTPQIVYAENEADAKRLAVELTLKGDNRHVQVKSKKK